jgi:hypothetical protein
LPQELLVEVFFIAQGKIQIFREAISLEIAFLEAGAAFEYPTLREFFVPINARKYPAQNVVFLDYAGLK